METALGRKLEILVPDQALLLIRPLSNHFSRWMVSSSLARGSQALASSDLRFQDIPHPLNCWAGQEAGPETAKWEDLADTESLR